MQSPHKRGCYGSGAFVSLTRSGARQAKIRDPYLAHAAEHATGDADDRRLARDVERFVAEMPVALTRRQALAVELRRVLDREDGMPISPPKVSLLHARPQACLTYAMAAAPVLTLESDVPGTPPRSAWAPNRDVPAVDAQKRWLPARLQMS
jgi:hypothetical protein